MHGVARHICNASNLGNDTVGIDKELFAGVDGGGLGSEAMTGVFEAG